MTTRPPLAGFRFSRTRQRASTLLAVFWILAVLSFAVTTTLMIVLTGIETESNRKQAFFARQLAESGIAIAANPIVDRWDPLLHFENESGDSFDVRIESEATRFHLNAALIREDRSGLLRLFAEGWNLNTNEAESLLDAMFDWIDLDDQVRRRGAENRLYAARGFPSLPLNRPFHSLDEVALVSGMETVEDRYPEWRDDLTLWSLSGKLDINEAGARLISLACECSINQAWVFVAQRSGSDGIPGTPDDITYGSADQVVTALGVQPDLESVLEERITFDEPAVRIQSLARVGDLQLMREIVMQRSGSKPFLYHLNERVLP